MDVSEEISKVWWYWFLNLIFLNDTKRKYNLWEIKRVCLNIMIMCMANEYYIWSFKIG